MQKRTQQITVRLTTQEKNHLDQQARLAGIKMEPFVRSLIAGSNVKERPAEYWGEMIRQLSAIGNNINQIAHVVNTRGFATKEDIAAVTTAQRVIWQIAKRL